MMTYTLYHTVNAIPVPADLPAQVLAACRAEAARSADSIRSADGFRRANNSAAPLQVVRYIPAAATAAACVAVLGLTLFSTGHLSVEPPTSGEAPGLSQGEPATMSAVENTPTTSATAAATTAEHSATTTGESASQGTTTATGIVSLLTGTTGAGTPALDKRISIVGRFQEMTLTELEAYYGHRVTPAWLPEDLEYRTDPGERLGIYHKDEEAIAKAQTAWDNLLNRGAVRDDAVIYDGNQFRWQSGLDERRELTVHLTTAPYPRYKLGDLSRFKQRWDIAGATAQVAYYSDSPYSDLWCYSALMEVDTIEYYVTAWNLTEEEFTRVLESLIQ